MALLSTELPTPLARACLLARAGQTTEALAALDAVRATDGLDLEGAAATLLVAETIDCRLARGDLGEAMSLADAIAGELDRPDRPDPVAALAHHALGGVAAALQETERSLHHFNLAGRLLARAGTDTGLVAWRVGAALASVRLGRRPEAARLASEQLELVTPEGSPYALALALRTLAATCAGAESVALLRRARATLGGLPTGRLAVQIDADLAGLLVLTGGRAAADEALALLRAAEEYAGGEELWPLQGRVRRLLDRLGAVHRPMHAEALAVLTGTERRVARLAADGLTNREIAARLDVGVKAVEWHLSHVYRKLGIRSRTRLPAALGLAPV